MSAEAWGVSSTRDSMLLVSELRGDSGTAAEACSTIDFASMSEMKESEKMTSYWEAVSCVWRGKEDHLPGGRPVSHHEH